MSNSAVVNSTRPIEFGRLETSFCLSYPCGDSLSSSKNVKSTTSKETLEMEIMKDVEWEGLKDLN